MRIFLAFVAHLISTAGGQKSSPVAAAPSLKSEPHTGDLLLKLANGAAFKVQCPDLPSNLADAFEQGRKKGHEEAAANITSSTNACSGSSSASPAIVDLATIGGSSIEQQLSWTAFYPTEVFAKGGDVLQVAGRGFLVDAKGLYTCLFRETSNAIISRVWSSVGITESSHIVNCIIPLIDSPPKSRFPLQFELWEGEPNTPSAYQVPWLARAPGLQPRQITVRADSPSFDLQSTLRKQAFNSKVRHWFSLRVIDSDSGHHDITVTALNSSMPSIIAPDDVEITREGNNMFKVDITSKNMQFEGEIEMYFEAKDEMNLTAVEKFIFTGYEAPNILISEGSTSIMNNYAYVKNSVLSTGDVDINVMYRLGSSASDFAVGSKVMIIQMQNRDWKYDDSNLGSTKNYEYGLVAKSTGSTITLFKGLKLNYKSGLPDQKDAKVTQIIKVVEGREFNIKGTLTAPPWNGYTGGIIVAHATKID
eukprot:UC4_evm1s1078